MAEITYPHVGITTKALQRRTAATATSTATTLLAPFMCDRGPAQQLVAIDSMDQFIRTFGSLDYSHDYQRQILSIGKWLGAGGRVLACRLVTTSDYIMKSMFLATKKEYSTSSPNKVFAWAIEKDGVSYISDDAATSLTVADTLTGTNSDINKLSITINGLTYYILLNGTEAAAASDSTNNYSHYSAFTGSGTAYSDFYDGADFFSHLKADYASGTDELVLINTATQASFNTGIVLTRPTSLSFGEGTDAVITLENAVKAKFSGTTAAAALTISGSLASYSLKVSANAKYYGSYYNNVSVSVTTDGLSVNSKTGAYSMYFDIIVYVKQNGINKAVEKYSSVEFDKLYIVGDNSEYIENLGISLVKNSAETEISEISKTATPSGGAAYICLSAMRSATLNVATNGKDGSEYIDSILVGSLTEILKKPLETPFDVMLDCGYPESVKYDLLTLFCNTSTDINDVVRNDAFIYITPYTISGSGRTAPTYKAPAAFRPENGQINGVSCDFSNMAIMGQYAKVSDIYSADSGKEVFVPTTYFLAGMIPANDANNGVQWPLAGLTRGVIKDALWINELPTAAEKQEDYDSHINYIEKDDRGTCFMVQLTGTIDDTSLKFINNTRSLLKIKKQLTLIGRQYLHEFNDRLTKANLQNALNTYLSDWIQNRTLSYGAITLTDSSEDTTLTDEEIEIGLTVKFTGTIEIISISITVE